MAWKDKVYGRRRIMQMSEQLEAIQEFNRQAIEFARECRGILLVRQRIKEYTEAEPFKLKENQHSQGASKKARGCFEACIKWCDAYLKRSDQLLARVVLIRERSRLALEKCNHCDSFRRGGLECPLLETLAALNFDDELGSAAFETRKNRS